MKELTVNKRKLKLVEGNIVLLDVEALVNAANKSLVLGGGVAGAIRSYGGPSIQEECYKMLPALSQEKGQKKRNFITQP